MGTTEIFPAKAFIGGQGQSEITICRKSMISITDFMQKLPKRAMLDWEKFTADGDTGQSQVPNPHLEQIVKYYFKY